MVDDLEPRAASPLRWLPLALVASVLALHGTTACTGTGSDDCNCPATGIEPLVQIELPCAPTTLPTMNLTGVCAGTGATQNGELVFGASTGGSCTVALTYANGTTNSVTVQFSSQWLVCGSDPHGCGQQVQPVGLGSGYPAVLVVGSCGDAAAE
jgi:hypothetical protein